MKKFVVLLLSIFVVQVAVAQVRQHIDFNNGWKFPMGNDHEAHYGARDLTGSPTTIGVGVG